MAHRAGVVQPGTRPMWQPSRQETKPYDRVTNLEADNGLRAVGKPCDHFKMENAVTHEETGG